MQTLQKIRTRLRRLRSTLPHQIPESVTPQIFFCHVPKCAGTAVLSAIYNSIFSSYKDPKFRINGKASGIASQVCSKDMMEVREVLLSYHLSLSTFRFGSGHCYCRPWLVQAHKDSWYFITLLRDPVARWISEYVYNTYKSAGLSHNELSLEDYIASEKGRVTGISYLRYFSSIPEGYDGNFDQFVDEAITNLSNFSVVGTIERIEQWNRMFRKIFHRDIAISKKNTSPNPDVANRIHSDEMLMRQIRKLCEPDTQIYQGIVERISAVDG